MMKTITMIPVIISRKRSHHGCLNIFCLCPSWEPALAPLWPSGPMVPTITISINYFNGFISMGFYQNINILIIWKPYIAWWNAVVSC
jgi:hypothetical protein